MAKWGEGDPRWIVEERADATNVNNWHWTEKNATGWSKNKIKSLILDLVIEDDEHWCQISELSKCEGEASANNRKAKLIFFYEWDIKGEWKGRFGLGGDTIKGKFEIPNLSEENDPEDLDVIVTIDKNTEDSYKLKEFFRTKGSDKIREQLAIYIKDLRLEYSQGLILPTKGQPTKALNSTASKPTNEVKSKMSQPIVNNTSKPVGVRINCTKVQSKQEFMCQPSDLYRALTVKEMVCAFTRGQAEVEAEKGGRFVLFGGIVRGDFVKLEVDQLIEMRWRFQSWPEEHYSHVKIEFEQKEGTTELRMTQTGVPQDDFERTRDGWQRYYWQPIKETFGFGASLY